MGDSSAKRRRRGVLSYITAGLWQTS